MNTHTVEKLNDLNLTFYREIAPYFDSSRSYSWGGWEKLVTTLNIAEPDLFNITETKSSTNTLQVLDVGCGNGRFVEFLEKKQVQFTYLGTDSDTYLLDKARERYNSQQVQFKQNDIIRDLSKGTGKLYGKDLKKRQVPGQFNLIVAFGVLHHIPSYKLRLKFLKQLAGNLASNGFLIVGIWKFMELESYKKKAIPWIKTDIKPEALEPHDYLLPWQRGREAIRYCHYVDTEEQTKLIEESKLKLVTSFRADGKQDRMNEYLVLQCRDG
jgi:tRNA (uracil-5-)-methyltransferase TRM9